MTDSEKTYKILEKVLWIRIKSFLMTKFFSRIKIDWLVYYDFKNKCLYKNRNKISPNKVIEIFFDEISWCLHKEDYVYDQTVLRYEIKHSKQWKIDTVYNLIFN